MSNPTGLRRGASIMVFAAMSFFSSPLWSAQLDCSLLDPRVSVSHEWDGSAEASAGTLFKIGRASGKISGRARETVQNLAPSAPPNVQEAIELRAIYLFCGMVADAKDISTERKWKLFAEMQKLDGQPIRPDRASTRPASRPRLAVARSRAPVDQRRNGAPNIGESTSARNQAKPEVVGAEITGNNQKGAAAVISSGGPDSTGAAISACGAAGQNVTGIRVVQNGPGTALRVVQSGPGTGLKVVVSNGGDCGGVGKGEPEAGKSGSPSGAHPSSRP